MEDHNKAIQLEPENAGHYQNRGVAFSSLGQLQRAIEDYDEGILRDPNAADLYNMRGEAFRFLGFLDAAEKEYLKTIELNPKHPLAYYNLGLTYFGMKKPFHSVHVNPRDFCPIQIFSLL